MADFQNAFKVGLQASADAGLARKEIKDVFEEFARQVSEASQGVITVERQRAQREIRAKKKSFLTTLAFEVPDYKTVHVFVASANSARSPQELCEYEVSAVGYPVVLRYADVIDHCHDKSALEHGLENLLAAPQTGDKLRALLSTQIPASAGPGPTP